MKCAYANKEQKKRLISIVKRIGIFLAKGAYTRDNIDEINELEYLWEKASKTAEIIKIILSNEIPLRTYKAIGSMFEAFVGSSLEKDMVIFPCNFVDVIIALLQPELTLLLPKDFHYLVFEGEIERKKYES